MRTRLSLFLACAAAGPLGAQATRQSQVTPPPLTDTPELRAIKDLAWRAIGPANQAGRIPMVVGIPGDRSTYYVGAAAGGLFKTTNGGVTFEPLFDDQDNASIGDLAIAPSNHSILYLGTGEGNPRNSASVGDGVYKSLDGGQSWRKVLYVDELTGCSDVDIDPTNANIVWAGTHRHQRWPWYFTSGGGATGVYKSVDGGETWTRLSGKGNGRGLPEGARDRVGLSVHRANPDIVYVISETKSEGELWRTEDGGKTWQTVNREPNINFRPFYYSDVRADPRNPNVVYALSGTLYKSTDGGRTFQAIRADIHGDHQAMWIDPTDSDYVLEIRRAHV